MRVRGKSFGKGAIIIGCAAMLLVSGCGGSGGGQAATDLAFFGTARGGVGDSTGGVRNPVGPGTGSPVPFDPDSQATLVSIEVSPSALNLLQGATRQLEILGRFDDGSQVALTPSGNVVLSYNSSNTEAATVSATGLVSAVSPGVATVTVSATVEGVTRSVTVPVTVNSAPTGSRYLFVSEANAGTVGIYDPQTYALVASVPVGTSPRGLALDYVARTVLAVTSDGTGNVIDIDNPTATPATFSTGGTNSLAATFDPTRNFFWVANFSGSVSGRSADLSTGLGPTAVDLATEVVTDGSGNLVYTTQNTGGNPRLAVLDGTSGGLLHQVSTAVVGDEFADGLAYDYARNLVYVTNDDLDTNPDDTIVVLSPGDASVPPAVISHLPAGNSPVSVAVDYIHGRVYVSNADSNTVNVYNWSTDPAAPLTDSGTVLSTGNRPICVTHDSELDRIVVANQNDGTLSVYDGTTLTEIAGSPFAVGAGPYVVTVDNS